MMNDETPFFFRKYDWTLMDSDYIFSAQVKK